MIQFFRKIRQNLLIENKFSKYLLYAIGEIILVVIGILIALQLGINKENKEKADLGYKYLTEMKAEVLNDFFYIDYRIRNLKYNLENHEAALRTKNIDALPMDSIAMILSPVNLDFKISELTFNRMKNLGLTALTDNDTLNSEINSYYNSHVVRLKLSLDYIFEDLKKYLDYFVYQQDAIDLNVLSRSEIEFPSLYKESSIEEFAVKNRQNTIEFLTSIKGRALILNDLSNKRYALSVLKTFNTKTQSILQAIYEELKSKNPETEALPEFPSDADFKKISLSPTQLKKYVGTYQSKTDGVLTIFVEGTTLYFRPEDSKVKYELIPSREDRFFTNEYFAIAQFKKENDNIVGLTVTIRAEKRDFIKMDKKSPS